MNITINIQAPELANAIMALAASLGKTPVLKTNQTMVTEMQTMVAEANQANVTNFPNVAPITQAPPIQHSVPVAPPVQNVVPIAPPVMQQTPFQQPPIQQQAVPTSAPTYSMDQLAVAATQLVDAGRREELLQLLASFGAPALMQLPQEMYGSFATKLREMGARI
jgi:hypothetical protein